MTKNFQDEMIKKLFNPKNFGEIKNPDAVGESINPQCKDFTKIYLKIKNNVIKDAKFQTIGCMAAIAFSDEACNIVKGKTTEEAKKINPKNILKKIKGFPETKSHCSIMGPNAIRDAIENYEKKKK
ncbi:MAG: iron-sulfur cluster assembly scaffold protein [archaeon]